MTKKGHQKFRRIKRNNFSRLFLTCFSDTGGMLHRLGGMDTSDLNCNNGKGVSLAYFLIQLWILWEEYLLRNTLGDDNCYDEPSLDNSHSYNQRYVQHHCYSFTRYARKIYTCVWMVVNITIEPFEGVETWLDRACLYELAAHVIPNAILFGHGLWTAKVFCDHCSLQWSKLIVGKHHVPCLRRVFIRELVGLYGYYSLKENSPAIFQANINASKNCKR